MACPYFEVPHALSLGRRDSEIATNLSGQKLVNLFVPRDRRG
jgi:hypothetical protein